jgi:hypothetical protein
MSAKYDNRRTNQANKRSENMPKREPARTLWLCDLDEWKQFQTGEITAGELKERYQRAQQTHLEDCECHDQ